MAAGTEFLLGLTDIDIGEHSVLLMCYLLGLSNRYLHLLGGVVMLLEFHLQIVGALCL